MGKSKKHFKSFGALSLNDFPSIKKETKLASLQEAREAYKASLGTNSKYWSFALSIMEDLRSSYGKEIVKYDFNSNKWTFWWNDKVLSNLSKGEEGDLEKVASAIIKIDKLAKKCGAETFSDNENAPKKFQKIKR